MQTNPLEQFIQPAPVCAVDTRLAAVLRQVQTSGCALVVLLGDRHQPQGVISLARLLTFLPLAHAEQLGEATQLTLADCLERQPDLVEPVLGFLSTTPLATLCTELCFALNHHPLAYWVAVDAAGAYLGLLDQRRLYPKLLAVVNGSDHNSQHPASDSPELLLVLLQLFQEFPVPLMVQTNSGQVLLQTPAWQQQLNTLPDGASWQQEAEAVLNLNPVTQFLNSHPSASTDAPITNIGDSASGAAPIPVHISLASDIALNEIPQSLQDLSSAAQSPMGQSLAVRCTPGHDHHSCVCHRVMANGQELSWQFSCIKLGKLVADSLSQRFQFALNRASHQASVQQFAEWSELSEGSFQLATWQTTPMDLAQLDLAQFSGQEIWLVVAEQTQEQKHMNSQLVAQNADLLELNRLKDEFLACISHELKTPLTAVLGLSNLLKDQQLGPLNERQARYAHLIYQSGRHLILIVNDILDLTRIETNQLDLTLETIDLQDICQRAYDQAKYQLTSEIEHWNYQQENDTAIADKPFKLEIQPGLESIMADELRLRQMLGNLLSNAIKFTLADGEVGLTVERWEGWIAFTVWDTGIGIPADKQHLIFQKFQQLESPWTRKFEGTGLGLVLTQRLARLHGGDITFTSSEGKGSQFTLLLPPTPPWMGDPGQTPALPVKPSENRLIMVVESAPDCLEQLTEKLNRLGYRVAIARSGTEALTKIRRLQPAIVFLNPFLPSLSGWDLLTLLKSDPAAAHIPVVITASATEQTLERELTTGADGFLSIPIQSKALQHTLDRLLVQVTASNFQDLLAKLTVLHLRLGQPPVRLLPDSGTRTGSNEPLKIDLNTLFSPYSCRVLEVDDLEQAELLARVWKPNVILFDNHLDYPLPHLHQLAQSQSLSPLPIVTLTSVTTQAANQVAGLSVFPCLDPLAMQYSVADQPEVSALAQVLLVAAGINWMPQVLVVDLDSVPLALASQPGETPNVAGQAAPMSHMTRNFHLWSQAFQRYLRASGVMVSVGQSWPEVLDHLERKSVDLVFLRIGQQTWNSSKVEMLEAIAKIPNKPPILAWNCQKSPATIPTTSEWWSALEAIATRILPADLPIPDMLTQIHEVLNVSPST